MKRRYRKFAVSLFFMGTVLSSCATRYKEIDPANLRYFNAQTDSTLTFSYKTNVLSGRYQRKEQHGRVHLVAVKIVNTGNRSLNFNDLQLYAGSNAVDPYPLKKFYRRDRQKILYNLFYLPGTEISAVGGVLAAFFIAGGYPSDQSVASAIIVGSVIGATPLVTGTVNVVRGAHANHRFKKELARNDIAESTIQPGATTYGLLAVKDPLTSGLHLKIIR